MPRRAFNWASYLPHPQKCICWGTLPLSWLWWQVQERESSDFLYLSITDRSLWGTYMTSVTRHILATAQHCNQPVLAADGTLISPCLSVPSAHTQAPAQSCCLLRSISMNHRVAFWSRAVKLMQVKETVFIGSCYRATRWAGSGSCEGADKNWAGEGVSFAVGRAPCEWCQNPC